MSRRHNRGLAQVALRGDRPCALCPQPAANKIHLCTDCDAQLGHMLDPDWEGDPAHRIPASIPTYWSRLDPTPGTAGPQNRRAPGFASTPPCSLDALVMRDHRSRPNAVAPVWFARLPNGKDDLERPLHEPDGQPRPVEVALANLSTELWMQWGHHGPELPNGDVAAGGVHGLGGWLHHHRARIAGHPDVAGIHGFLADIQRDLQTACQDRDEDPVGKCTAWLPRPGGERVLCAHPIYPPVPGRDPDHEGEDDVTHCGRCGAPYGKLDRYRLARAQRSESIGAISAG